jgi:radical SAM superfamily enzyme YgiQ (UPF0313 family)
MPALKSDGPALRVVLLATYELGRQPFGIASPAAWLRKAGIEVTVADTSLQPLPEAAVRAANLIAFHLPMHTATRLAIPLAEHARALNPDAHLCYYGLYAPMNSEYLLDLGPCTILGGEFENGLLELCERLRSESTSTGYSPEPISLDRQHFLTPDRSGLPELGEYAELQVTPDLRKTVGYTEATRGCKHLCRHCPVVPVYGGKFRIVQRDIVVQDIAQQVQMGAEHITFGDPDFLNGIGHSIPLVKQLHQEFPHLTYDATIKVEHLLKHAEHLSTLQETGCLIVTSAIESVDDQILERMDKGHTREDFAIVARLLSDHGLILNPTFIPFTPWTTLEGYLDHLQVIEELDLIEHASPVQHTIRLLIPGGSLLLELEDIREFVGAFDRAGLAYPWANVDPLVDELQSELTRVVTQGEANGNPRREIFGEIRTLAHATAGRTASPLKEQGAAIATIPYLTEPWYC